MLPDDTEEWRPVTRAPEHYEVSNFGRVRRATYAPTSPYMTMTSPGRLRKLTRGHHDYQFVILSVRNKIIPCIVHQLVAEAFLDPKPTPQHTVNHIDGDPTNNHVRNLEWATRLEQTQHAIRLGLMDPNGIKQYQTRGEQHYAAKLTEEIVRVIRNAPPRFSSLDLAELFGCSTSTVSRIQTRKNWEHVD
jgi:hypothetical protein